MVSTRLKNELRSDTQRVLLWTPYWLLLLIWISTPIAAFIVAVMITMNFAFLLHTLLEYIEKVEEP